MELKRGGQYRARNGKIFTIEKLPTSFFSTRREAEDYPFCAKSGLFTWREDGKFSYEDCGDTHPLDLVEELPEGYEPTKLEDLSLAMEKEVLDIADKELDEHIVLKLPKWQLMFLLGLVGNTNPAAAYATVLSSHCRELSQDVHWEAFHQLLHVMDSHNVFETLLSVLAACGDSKTGGQSGKGTPYGASGYYYGFKP